jgi:hypothetical protein
MPRQPIKTHQREVSRFVLQWLVPLVLRYVQWDLSFKVCTDRIPIWIHLLDVIGMLGFSFLPSLKIPPSWPPSHPGREQQKIPGSDGPRGAGIAHHHVEVVPSDTYTQVGEIWNGPHPEDGMSWKCAMKCLLAFRGRKCPMNRRSARPAKSTPRC